MSIVLYLKESPMGLKYLGKCVNRDPYRYMGSGKRWKNHIRKYSLTAVDIKTTVLLETTDKTELKQMGEYYSTLWNVVENPEFANLRPEKGDGGWEHMKGKPKSDMWKEAMSTRVRTSEERKKMSDARKGIVFSKETREKMSIARKEQRDSPERIAKRAASISKARKGKPLTEQHKQALKKPKDKNNNCTTCELCGVYTTKTVISRNHGKDKCKKQYPG
jgi:Pyruvate/2-oxoacid:ferredoxin oxidoreductase delta subunit